MRNPYKHELDDQAAGTTIERQWQKATHRWTALERAKAKRERKAALRLRNAVRAARMRRTP